MKIVASSGAVGGSAEVAVALSSGSAAGAGAVPREPAVSLPRLGPLAARLGIFRVQVATRPLAGRLALGTLILGALVVVLFAASGPSTLVPSSAYAFPAWESGPLHFVNPLLGSLARNATALNDGFSVVVVLMAIAYGVALASVRTMSMRMIVGCLLALHAILLLSPPLQLTDLFNYLGYGRLGGLHQLNPYTHVIANEIHDPVYRFSSWHHLRSPYGELFTAASYPLSYAPLSVAYWLVKIGAVLGSLGFIALVWKCARLLGKDPRFAVLFVAANPIYLMYAVGGFHNDFYMLVPSTAAIALMLSRRDRSAGAMVMVAVAVKFTAILLLPFLLIAVRPSARRLKILVGASLAAVPLIAMSLVLFGFSIPNLSDQSTLLTDFSIPNVFGLLIGVGGGTPGLLRVANVVLVLAVAYLIRRRGDWLSSAGWGTLALIASLAWLVPWYVIWLLPLAALGSSIRLRRAALAFTVYLVFAFIPITGRALHAVHLDLMSGSAGQASHALQKKLEQ